MLSAGTLVSLEETAGTQSPGTQAMLMAAASSTAVPSSQTQDVNPFLDTTSARGDDSTYKLSPAPSQSLPSLGPSRKSPKSPSSKFEFRMPSSPVSAWRMKASCDDDEVIPSSQAGEELLFLSPARPPRTPEGLCVTNYILRALMMHAICRSAE